MIQRRRAPFPFFLTGSRFFGEETEVSDWDFFAQYSKEIRLWLDQHGFVVLSSDYWSSVSWDVSYSDLNMSLVLQRMNVQVQLQRNVSAKRHVQDIIYADPMMRKLVSHCISFEQKRVAKSIWNGLFLAYQRGGVINGQR